MLVEYNQLMDFLDQPALVACHLALPACNPVHMESLDHLVQQGRVAFHCPLDYSDRLDIELDHSAHFRYSVGNLASSFPLACM